MAKAKHVSTEQLAHVVDEAKKLSGNRTFHVGILAGAAITVAVAIFIFHNNDTTRMRYLWLDFDAPLWAGLLASFVPGCLAAPLLGWSWRRHRRIRDERKAAARELRQAEKALG